MESYRDEDFIQMGMADRFCQDNHSWTKKAGTLRGIHFQNEPYAQGKLVRCISGKVLDVVVDLRRGSPTHLQWASAVLDADNHTIAWVPPGFGHAVLALADGVHLAYKCTRVYHADADRSIRWNDPDIGIKWPIDVPHVSEKDAGAPFWKDSDVTFAMGGDSQ